MPGPTPLFGTSGAPGIKGFSRNFSNIDIKEVYPMKIAVSSCGIFLDSPIDPRFGRCDYFVIVDTFDMSFEACANENVGLAQGAGIQSAQFVISKGARTVITGNIGPNALLALSAADVEVVVCHSGTITEAIENYRNGKLKSVERPSVRDHFGMVGEAARNRAKAPKGPAEGKAGKKE
jgi:predicted Fe-Mo cluster-binding NifX family protein